MDSDICVEEAYDDEIDDLLTSFQEDPNRKNHMELLADAFFDHLYIDNVEYGGWGLDSKRPFGNSHVEPDIAQIIGFDRSDVYKDGDLDKEFVRYLRSLYNDLGIFLRYRWLELKKTAANVGSE